jgi:hypothetical protein
MSDLIPTLEGFKRVQEHEFWKYVNPLNIHPTTLMSDRTLWKDPSQQTRAISFPGWKNPRDPEAFFIPQGPTQ